MLGNGVHRDSDPRRAVGILARHARKSRRPQPHLWARGSFSSGAVLANQSIDRRFRSLVAVNAVPQAILLPAAEHRTKRASATRGLLGQKAVQFQQDLPAWQAKPSRWSLTELPERRLATGFALIEFTVLRYARRKPRRRA